MRKSQRRKTDSTALAYDLGGTKVAVAIVNSKGQVLDEIRAPVMIQKGKHALIAQLAELGKELLYKHPRCKRVGIASAGPLDPEHGVLLDPTNFVTDGKTWGKFPITRLLSSKLKLPVYLDNDAAAAILAEHWVGRARGFENAMILTLGTGLGTAIIANNQLVRSGRNLHTEAGHVIINYTDTTAPCGCGNLGCAEAYLSGKNFTLGAQKRLKSPGLTSLEIANLARKKDPVASKLFEEYSELMAIAIHNYVAMFSPEVIVFTGSFAATSDLFLKPTQKHLERLLARRRVGVDLVPKLMISSLENQAGIIGGAYVALFRDSQNSEPA